MPHGEGSLEEASPPTVQDQFIHLLVQGFHIRTGKRQVNSAHVAPFWLVAPASGLVTLDAVVVALEAVPVIKAALLVALEAVLVSKAALPVVLDAVLVSRAALLVVLDAVLVSRAVLLVVIASLIRNLEHTVSTIRVGLSI